MANVSISFHNTGKFEVTTTCFPATAERGEFHTTKIRFEAHGAPVEIDLFADSAEAFGNVFNVSGETK